MNQFLDVVREVTLKERKEVHLIGDFNLNILNWKQNGNDSPWHLQTLVDDIGIHSIKDAVGDFDFSKKQLELLRDKVDIYSGNDNQTYDFVINGGVGVVSVASHVIGDEIAEMISFAKDNDLEKADGGNKAAAQRVRTGSIRFEKVAEVFRKESIASEKRSAGKPRRKPAAKRKAVTKKKATRKNEENSP